MEQKFEVELHDVYVKWRDKLRNEEARTRIAARIEQIQEDGNFGEHKLLRDSVWELKIRCGPGYRVYYTQVGNRIILLLCGGDKSSQNRDIERAISLAKEIKYGKEK